MNTVRSAGQSRTSIEGDDDDGVPLRSQSTTILKSFQPLIPEIIEKQQELKQLEKISLIGRGNIGRVYLVQNKDTKKCYALKVIEKKLIKEVNREKIEIERKILKEIKHPFIIHLYEDFETSLYYFSLMSYCAGGDFYSLLQKQPGKCFKENIAKFYLAEILICLEYLHIEGIVYRDLKPENILLTETGHIMLSDFDLSRRSEEDTHLKIKPSLFGKDEIVVEPNNFRAYSIVGTNEYLAPEILNKDGYNSSVDWWTFGVLMYEFLFGFNPFVSSSLLLTHENIKNGDFSFPKKHIHKVSDDAKDLIKELLDVDSEDRLGSKYGASEIKEHDFFEKIKFPLIRHRKPPIIPELKDPFDTSYFRQFNECDDDIPNDWGLSIEEKLGETKPSKKKKSKRNKTTSPPRTPENPPINLNDIVDNQSQENKFLLNSSSN